MYAFRKPFNAGTYEGLSLWGMDYKTVLVITQVLGYMASKFIGVKVISELDKRKRALMIIGFILIAELALFFFGLVPHPYNFIFLFINGLPLGMVWGLVFSFLEGRRLTELLSVGLATSAIVSSGTLKTIGRTLIEKVGISDFWMPFTTGALFIPLVLFFVWMLTMIPKPSEKDLEERSEREAMTPEDRKTLLQQYGLGILGFVLAYTLLTICRDFRDNFMVEIWNETGKSHDLSVFFKTEFIIALCSTVSVGFLVLIKDHQKGLMLCWTSIFIGFVVLGGSTLLYQQKGISTETWMTVLGIGIYLGAIPFQIVLYERLFAYFRWAGNVGFLMYLSDSTGYLGSVAVMIGKELMPLQIAYLPAFKQISLYTSVTGMLLMIGAGTYFFAKSKTAIPSKFSFK